MANDMGLFSKMGLDIRMKIFMDGALVVAPMLSAEVDIGVMTPNAGFFNSLYRGGPFRAFLCNGQGRRGRAVTAVVMRTDHYDAGVKALPDLARMKGKLAAVGAAGSINQYGLGSALKLAGLDPLRDVQWQTSVGQPDIVKQLGQKQVDRCGAHLSSRLPRPAAELLQNLAVTRRNPARLAGGDHDRSR